MKQMDMNQVTIMDGCPEEVLATLHSIQCLIMLVERHKNHPDTIGYLNLISTSLIKLESQINRSINKRSV